jgi:hypothetical protein
VGVYDRFRHNEYGVRQNKSYYKKIYLFCFSIYKLNFQFIFSEVIEDIVSYVRNIY